MSLTSSDLYKQDSVDKQLNIAYEGGTITNSDLNTNEFCLTESICDLEELRFGSFLSSEVKFTALTTANSLVGKELYITETLDGSTVFNFGTYTVSSDVPKAGNIKWHEITAYDSLHDLQTLDVAAWYNELFEGAEKVSMLDFRDSFFAHIGIVQAADILVNDSFEFRKTIAPNSLSAETVLFWICEANGVFGKIGRDNKFHYAHLKPNTSSDAELVESSLCISFKYETYTTQKITKLVTRDDESSIGYETGTGDNAYVITGNALLFGCQDAVVLNNILTTISSISYVPFEADFKGNPTIETGDLILYNDGTKAIKTYVLSRELKGIQALRDYMSAKGQEAIENTASPVNLKYDTLLGKVTKIQADVNGLSVDIDDLAESTETSFQTMSGQISAKVSKGDVVNEINISTEAIELSGNRLIVDTDGFELDSDGKAKFKSDYYHTEMDSNGFAIHYDGTNKQTAVKFNNHKMTYTDPRGYEAEIMYYGYDADDVANVRIGSNAVNLEGKALEVETINDVDVFYDTIITSGNWQDYISGGGGSGGANYVYATNSESINHSSYSYATKLKVNVKVPKQENIVVLTSFRVYGEYHIQETVSYTGYIGSGSDQEFTFYREMEQQAVVKVNVSSGRNSQSVYYNSETPFTYKYSDGRIVNAYIVSPSDIYLNDDKTYTVEIKFKLADGRQLNIDTGDLRCMIFGEGISLVSVEG